MDGTIANTLPMVVDIVNRMGPDYGVDPIKDVNKLRELPSEQVYKALGISRIRFLRLFYRVREELGLSVASAPLFEGIVPVLEDLKKSGVILGLLSTNSEDNMYRFLDAHGLDCFSFVESGGIFGKAKVIKNIISSRAIDPKSCFLIGDETRDIASSKKAGVLSVAVTWGYNTQRVLEAKKPTYIVNTPKELLRTITPL